MRTLSFRNIASLVAFAIAIFCAPLAAQDYLQGVGKPVYTTAMPVELGMVDATNGNLHLEIPVGSFPQRGGKPITYKFVYDSRIWMLVGGTGWAPNTTASPWLGWRFVSSGSFGSGGSSTYVNFCGNNPPMGDQIVNNFYWQAPDGTVHYFTGAQLQFTNNCGGTVQLCTAGADGQGYWMWLSTTNNIPSCGPAGEWIHAPDGTVYSYSGNTITDANGNYHTDNPYANIVDTLGRTPVIVTSSCGTNQTCYDVLNSQGGTTRSRWIVTTQTIAVNTGFPNGNNWSGNLTAMKSIQLPDGTTYQFTYDSGTGPYHYGEVTGITFPTGGSAGYGYTVYQDALQHYNRWVIQHTSSGGTTSYTLGNVNTVNQTQQVTVTKPSGDYSVFSYNVQTSAAWRSSVNMYSAAGTLLESVAETRNGVLLASEVVTLPTPSGSISKQTTYSYADSIFPLIPLPYPTTIKEWNYYSGSPGANPDRITNITYMDQVNSAYGFSPGKGIFGLPSKVQVTDGAGSPLSETDYSYDTTAVASMPNIVMHDDTNYGAGMTTRGNRTQVQQATSFTGGTPNLVTVSTMTYDQTGQLVSSKDANNNTTTYSFADCYLTGNPPVSYTPSQATNAYLTSTTLPVSGNVQNCYYWNTGKTAWSKDQNSATTSNFYITYGGSSNDPFDRLITTTLPTGGWALNVFSTPPTTVDTYTSITASSPTTSCTSAGSCRHDQSLFDGLARPTDQILVNDPDGLTKVHSDYDTSGRVLDTSHPYRSTSDPTYGFETPTYDGLNRTIQMLHQDNNKSKMYYGAAVTGTGVGGLSTQSCGANCHLGYPTLSVDESGKMRQTWTDAFGHVVEVDEPNKSAALGSWGTLTYTYYQYDQLGNLTLASVPLAANVECNRTYTYDSLSRVTSSTEPEPGKNACTDPSHTTQYLYTANGGGLCSGSTSSLCRRTDGRGITTTYNYDVLNRPTGMSYTDSTPSVTYFYDQTSYNGLTITNGAGRKTGMSDGSGQVAWSFDANGNILTEKRTVTAVSPSVTKTVSYGYNKDNSLATLVYPSGRVVSFAVSNAQRTTSAIDSNGTQYALPPSSGWEYAPTGALATAVYGKSGSFSGITETRSYNNRMQLTGVSATSSGGNALNLAPGYNANGEIVSITNSLDSGRTQNYTYDSLSRILTGSSTATSGIDCWGQNLTIDNVGNLTNIALSKCSGGILNAPVNQNNQFTTGYTYDQAGNLTSDGTYTYAYNAENELTSANGVTYVYDGNRMRVKKSSGSLYWRDVNGQTIAISDLTGGASNEHVFFAGRRIAQIGVVSGTVRYYFADQIGSTRAVASSAGALLYDADFTPYGAEMAHTTTFTPPFKFTGYERDSETGLDYAFNRYYNSRIGRFMSPDPSGISSATLGNPQSLHRYAYVLNNPLIAVDPLGLECAFLSNDGTTVIEVDPTGTTSDELTYNSCTMQGGYYFTGNQDVNFNAPLADNGEPDWTVSGGMWGHFSIDPNSNWVAQDNNQLSATIQVSCAGRSGSCDYSTGKEFGQSIVDDLNRTLDDGVHVIGHARLVVNGGERHCGESVAEAGIGLVATVGEGILIGMFAPEVGEMSLVDWVHVGPGLAAAPVLLGHGTIRTVQNCF